MKSEANPGLAVDRRSAWLGVTYLVLCQWVTLSAISQAFAWPFLSRTPLVGVAATDAGGLRVLGLYGLVVAFVAVWKGTVSQGLWALTASLAAWMLGPWLSAVLLGSIQDSRYFWVVIATTTIPLAAALISRTQFVSLLRAMGWFYGWGSIVCGLSDLVLGWPTVLIESDERHRLWLSHIGIHLDGLSILNGLSPGRLFLSMTCGVLLVVVWRQRCVSRAAPLSTWVLLVGLAAAMIWSAGRVGLMAAVPGLVGAAIPWQRLAAWWAPVGVVGIPIVPLVASRVLTLGPGSAQWRFDLWSYYFKSPEVGTPLGLGPRIPEYAVEGHAHNQFLETLATGGWIGLTGLTATLGVAMYMARRSMDNAASYGALFAMSGIFAFDVLTFTPVSVGLNAALVIALAVIANSGRTLLHENPFGRPHETLHGDA